MWAIASSHFSDILACWKTEGISSLLHSGTVLWIATESPAPTPPKDIILEDSFCLLHSISIYSSELFVQWSLRNCSPNCHYYDSLIIFRAWKDPKFRFLPIVLHIPILYSRAPHFCFPHWAKINGMFITDLITQFLSFTWVYWEKTMEYRTYSFLHILL